MCGTCGARTALIRRQRARVSSVEKTPSFSFCQVDMYGTSTTATGRKQTPYFYQLNGEILQVIPNTPYLGITLTTDLKFNIHLNKNIA